MPSFNKICNVKRKIQLKAKSSLLKSDQNSPIAISSSILTKFEIN